MEVPRDEEQRERTWRCNRCEMKGDKMCYQHIVSYLFPVSKKNVSPQSEKITQKTISIESNKNPIESNKNPIESKKNPIESNKNPIESKKIEEEKVVGDGKLVESMECTQGVCENGAKKVAHKVISSTRVKEKKFSKSDIMEMEEDDDDNEPIISIRVKKGRGQDKKVRIARKRFRKIAANGGEFAGNTEGLGSVVEVEEVEVEVEEEKEVEMKRRRKCLKGGEEKQEPFYELLELSNKSNRKGVKIDLKTCHQCHRSDKGRVIRCTKCNSKRFCIPCITNWYPRMTEEQVALACPLCLGNCNCKACLRMDGRIKVKDGFKISHDMKIEHSKTLLRTILPFLKQYNEEQMSERELEAKVQGVLVSEVEVKNAIWQENERVFCNNCRNSIVDFHRSCPKCKYLLCLTCCREVRAGQLQGCEQVIMEYVGHGFHSLNGKSSSAGAKKPDKGYNASKKKEGKARCKTAIAQLEKTTGGINAPTQSRETTGGNSRELLVDDLNMVKPEWKADNNGAIPCPPSIYEGCGGAFLELKSILSDGWISKLLKRAEKSATKLEHENSPHAPEVCSCSASGADSGSSLQKCASREGSNDNYLYWPDSRDIQLGDLKHFQWHWFRREPIIVRNVLETTLGLSWEPMVMWRAFRQLGNTKNSTPSNVKAINCLDWSEVDLNVYQFFKGYSQGHIDSAKRKQPVILQLKDWPPNGKFEQRLPRHSAEFIRALPFKEYTHPRDGVLNLAAKLPLRALKPDLGPKTYIAYGRSQELGCGDSVTKLHSHMSDVVNILAHTTEVTVHLGKGTHPSGSSEGSEHDREGALWDIFRREDVPKLQEFLRKHYLEFRHKHSSQLNQVIHPIYDQTFYLTEEHKRKLKAEYGIEPWTFVQKLGEAVFVPCGCPHQVRNLKSCIKVALEFVSPENVHECIRLTRELRSLPRNHRAKEDKLEVWKMIIHAVKEALNDLET